MGEEDYDAVSLGSSDEDDGFVYSFSLPSNSGTNAHLSAAGDWYITDSHVVSPTVLLPTSNICAHCSAAKCDKCKGFEKMLEDFFKSNWLLDSGASAHFSNDKADFTELQDIDPIPVKTANGLTHITARGSVRLSQGSNIYMIEPVFLRPQP